MILYGWEAFFRGLNDDPRDSLHSEKMDQSANWFRKIIMDLKTNRVTIYGWHKLDGKPIQPLFTGHVDWYVDYFY